MGIICSMTTWIRNTDYMISQASDFMISAASWSSPSVTPSSTTKCNQAGFGHSWAIAHWSTRKAGFKENVKTKSGGGLRRSTFITLAFTRYNHSHSTIHSAIHSSNNWCSTRRPRLPGEEAKSRGGSAATPRRRRMVAEEALRGRCVATVDSSW